MQAMLTFKLSCHGLEIETERWPGTPTDQRLCKYCTRGAVDIYSSYIHISIKCDAHLVLRQLPRHRLGSLEESALMAFEERKDSN